MTIGYCVKCKAKKEMVFPKLSKNSKGLSMVRGTCKKCGTKMCKMGGL